ELPLERILEHAMERASRLLELVFDTHWGILPSLTRTAFAKRAVPSLQPRGINGLEISYSFRDESDSPVESAPRTLEWGSRGRFLFRCRRRPRRRRRFRPPTYRRGRGRRRLSGPGRDFPRGDHRDPLDEHPVSRHSDELDSLVQQDR